MCCVVIFPQSTDSVHANGRSNNSNNANNTSSTSSNQQQQQLQQAHIEQEMQTLVQRLADYELRLKSEKANCVEFESRLV